MNENLQRLETKVENQGSTPQGKVSAAEWNILVAAVKALDAAGIDTETLAKYLKQYQYITTPELEELLKDVTENLDGVVDLKSAQTIEGLKDFVNGFMIGGALVKYDATKKCFIFTENVLMEKGLAWNSRLEDFTEEEIFSITKAVDVDWKTIGKNASGQLYVINGGGEGGGGNYDPDFLQNYLTANKYITESALEPYAKTEDVNSLLTEYLPKSGGIVNGDITATGDVSAQNVILNGNISANEGFNSFNTPLNTLPNALSSGINVLRGSYADAGFDNGDISYWWMALDIGFSNKAGTSSDAGYRSQILVPNTKYHNRLFLRRGGDANWLSTREFAFADSDSLSPASGTLTINGMLTATDNIGAYPVSGIMRFRVTCDPDSTYIQAGNNDGGNDGILKITGYKAAWLNHCYVKSPIFEVGGNILAAKFIGALQGTADRATSAQYLHLSDIQEPINYKRGSDQAVKVIYTKNEKLDGFPYNWTTVLSIASPLSGFQIGMFGNPNTIPYPTFRAMSNVDSSWSDWKQFAFADSDSLSPASGTLTINGMLTATDNIGAYPVSGIMRFRVTCDSDSTYIQAGNNDGGNNGTLKITGYKAAWLNHCYVKSPIFEVGGNILATGRIAWNSSRVLKTEVKEHYLSLEELAQIKPYQYKWKDGRDDLVHVGAIADEVMDIMPETVLTDTLGIHSMDYAQTAFVMVASLTPHVSDHERRIKELETENVALKEEIEKLKRVA